MAKRPKLKVDQYFPIQSASAQQYHMCTESAENAKIDIFVVFIVAICNRTSFSVDLSADLGCF